MYKTCGLPVINARILRGESLVSTQDPQSHIAAYVNNSLFFPFIRNFYTHIFTSIFSRFLSVTQTFYTVYTPLIITKTILFNK